MTAVTNSPVLLCRFAPRRHRSHYLGAESPVWPRAIFAHLVAEGRRRLYPFEIL